MRSPVQIWLAAPYFADIAQSVERILGKDEVASSNLAISSKTLNLLEIQGFFIFTEKAEDILLSPLYRKGSFSYLSYLIWSYQKFYEKLLISLLVNYTVKKPTFPAGILHYVHNMGKYVSPWRWLIAEVNKNYTKKYFHFGKICDMLYKMVY